MALTVSARSRWNGPSTPALIRAAALCAAAGIGLSITEYADSAKWLAIVGVVLMLVGLHRFGRSGPDEAIRFQLEPARKKKKKKKKSEALAEERAEQPGADEGRVENDEGDGNAEQ